MFGKGVALRLIRGSLLALAVLAFGPAASGVANPSTDITTSYGYAVFGELKYEADFEHLEYVNPDAPIGGEYRYGQSSSFDNVNMISILGTYPPTMQFLQDTLMEQSRDETASYYCLVCESVSWPADFAWAEFKLRQDVHFGDGHQLNADDILYSASLGDELTWPSYSRIPQVVERSEKTGEFSVKFHFKQKKNPTLITILAFMPIAPQHYWESRDPYRPTVEPPLALSPYKLVDVNPGKSIKFERDPDYWGWDHPLRIGRFNFQKLRNDYYRDLTLQNEAFKAGLNDFKLVVNAWERRNERELPAIVAGNIRFDTLKYDNGALFNSITLNARTKFLSDRNVRKAMVLAYDFEWVRRSILGGEYGRLGSNFSNMEFAAEGLPSEGELQFLEPYRDSLPPEIFTQEPLSPIGGSREQMRANLLEARELLREAGYQVRDGQLRYPDNGEPVELTLLAYSPLKIGEVALFMRNAEKLGVKITFRAVDAAQMRHRSRNYQYDILYARTTFAPFPTPSAGMLQVYSSQAADTPSSLNYAGIKEPAIDDTLGQMVQASKRETVVDAMKAVDRIIRFGYYLIPLQHAYPAPVGEREVAYWDKFGRPEVEQTWNFPFYSLDSWWYDEEKAEALSHGTYR